jgi:hypothetical protein
MSRKSNQVNGTPPPPTAEDLLVRFIEELLKRHNGYVRQVFDLAMSEVEKISAMTAEEVRNLARQVGEAKND